MLLFGYSGESFEESWTWLKAGQLSLEMGVLLDGNSIFMLALVCLVSLLVQIYSHGYMAKDNNYCRFFAFVSLFTGSMLSLVLSSNLFQFYFFWELVGVCSYLLIGFWHQREAASQAAFKAFLVNRIGDAGFLLGILLLALVSFDLWPEGTFLNFSYLPSLVERLSNPGIEGWIMLMICLLIFMGTMAKSAQFPLHTWLPDAMEGPTPISALIHAATMVAAGVFLLIRTLPLYEVSPEAKVIVASIGAFTSLYAAFLALNQTDIKKVLAYSTCSQLGLMVMAVGIGAWTSGAFHLLTHAFFKALLFLCAGSIIHSCLGEQAIRRFGGLKDKLPITHWTFLIGTMCLAGVPLLSGFWSKEAIIKNLWHWSGDSSHIIFTLVILASALTAFYIFRLYFLTFCGEYRGENEDKIHESPSVMKIPLIILALGSILIGFVGTELEIFGGDVFASFIAGKQQVQHHSISLMKFFGEIVTEAPALLALGAFLLGSLAAIFYFRTRGEGDTEKPRIVKWLNIDKFYEFILRRILKPVSLFFYKLFDLYLIQGALSLFSGICLGSGWLLSLLQRGRTQVYVLIMIFGLSLALGLSLSMAQRIEHRIAVFIQLQSVIPNR